MYGLICSNIIKNSKKCYYVTTARKCHNSCNEFETVFSLPSVGYIAILNRLKVFHIIGSSLIIPTCTAMELLNIMPENIGLSATYIGVTGAALLSLASLPFHNVIGHLYISKDNKQIKISSVDFWGKRKDRIIPAEEWIPLLDMKPRNMDAIYLSPQLTDGTKYKLLIKFGKILNSRKMSEVLE